MRNLFIEDLKNIKSEVLSLKQSYIRGLDRINCFTNSTTCNFTHPIGTNQYLFRLTITFQTTSTYEPFNMLGDGGRIYSTTARVWNTNTKTLIIAGNIICPSTYTLNMIATAPIISMKLEDRNV